VVDPADEWTPLLPAADVDGSSASAAKVTFVCPDSVSSAALDRVRTMPRPRTSDSQTSSSSTAGRTFPRKRPQLPLPVPMSGWGSGAIRSRGTAQS